jgi:hypothetical protein
MTSQIAFSVNKSIKDSQDLLRIGMGNSILFDNVGSLTDHHVLHKSKVTGGICNGFLIDEERCVNRGINGKEVLSMVKVLDFDGVKQCVA